MSNTIASILKAASVALVALALVVFISACGSSSSDGDDAATNGGGDDAEEHVDDADEGGDSVHVSLNEWSITPADGETFEASAGEVVFEIRNDGNAPHDLVIIKTDLAPDALPIADGLVDQEAAGEVIGGVDPLPGDIEVQEPFNLDAGSHVIICSIPGHYQQGMNAQLTVQ